MKNCFVTIALLGVAALGLGCAGTMPGPGGVMPGALFTSTTIPGDLTFDQVYQAYPDSFVVLGMVEGSSGNVNILSIFAIGDAGYRKAIDNAKAQVGADGIINCVADIKSTSVLGLFSSAKTTVRGLAIKRK